MSFHSMRLTLVALLLGGLLGACGGHGGPAPPPAGGITVTPGDGQVTITWVPDADVEYWLFYAPTASISTSNLSNAPGHLGRIGITSPYVLTGLVNGFTYSFTIDGRFGNGPGGPGTPSVSAIPRPAGTTWSTGGPLNGTPGSLGAASLHGIAFGTASNAFSYFVATGDGGALFRSNDGAGWTTLSTTITANLNAATYMSSNFITVGGGGNIYYSSDTVNWSQATSNTAQNLNAVATNGLVSVAVGDNGAIVFSGNVSGWLSAAVIPTGSNLYGVSYGLTPGGGGLWVAVGAGGTLLTSGDGTNWSAVASGTTADLKGVAFRGATTVVSSSLPSVVSTSYPSSIVVVGLGGKVLQSTDGGGTWPLQTTVSPASDLLAVSATSSQFLAVGANGAAFTSVDGTSWTSRTTGTALSLFGLIDAQAQYVAVGQTGTTVYSR